MPQELFWVREKASGLVFQMHSVDAAEGMALGDYEVVSDPDKDLTPEERQAAAAGHRSTAATPHPELQTPEQRTETRRLANEQAAGLAGAAVPVAPQALASASRAPGRVSSPVSSQVEEKK